MPRIKLHWQILIAIGLAFIAGSFVDDATRLGVALMGLFDFLGTLFLNALKMIIVPLIVSSIITGIAGIGSSGDLGRLGFRTIAYYLSTSLIAILIGLVVVNLFTPGIVDGQPAREVLGLSAAAAAEAQAQVGGTGWRAVLEVFLRMVPPNIVAAAADGQMLGLIFFSLLFGYFMTRVGEPMAQTQYRFWNGIFQTMMLIVELIMKFAPIGIFGLVAKVVGGVDRDNLGELVQSLGMFALSVVTALGIHAFVVMPVLLVLLARVNPLRHYQAMAAPLLTAFSTASSSATLPLTMEAVEKNVGVSNRTSSFVLPLGATVNMDGTALYECVAAIFIAQAYGLDLSLTTQFTIVFVALITSIGVAGVPAASLVAITIILTAVGLPLEGIGLILAVDRILDMFRTAVNVFSDSVGTVVIARLEGESGFYPDAEPAASSP